MTTRVGRELHARICWVVGTQATDWWKCYSPSAVWRQAWAGHASQDQVRVNHGTHIHACEHCGVRLLDFAMAIHYHESHSVIVKDVDGVNEWDAEVRLQRWKNDELAVLDTSNSIPSEMNLPVNNCADTRGNKINLLMHNTYLKKRRKEGLNNCGK